jgi:hypothetical protein
MRYLFLSLFLLVYLAGQSQQTKVVDLNKNDAPTIGSLYYVVGDAPVSSTKYVKIVAGTPYFSETWMRAQLEMERGTIYQRILVRLDLMANELQYVGPNGTELIATTPVKTVTLKDSITQKEYKFVNSVFLQLSKDMEHGWYQQLTSGTATLYKKAQKSIKEDKPYGSATVEQTINTYSQYYIDIKSSLTLIKKIKEIPDLLKDKKDELVKYISSHKLSGKTDEDYIELVTYYNTLLSKSNSVASIR